MSNAVVIAYPPMAGGNHFKNLLWLDPVFGNSGDLRSSVYTDPSTDPPGTAHSVGGRNVHQYLFDDIFAKPEYTWVISGHFGELAPWREQLNSIDCVKYIVITIDTGEEINMLYQRQEKLGGTSGHPYYLEEEQPYLYDAAMYSTYFRSDCVLTTSLSQAWDPDLTSSKLIDTWNKYLNTNVDITAAQQLHALWWDANFKLTNDNSVG